MNSGEARLRAVLLAGQAFRERQEAAETGAKQSAESPDITTIDPPIEISKLPTTDPFYKTPFDLTTRLDRVKRLCAMSNGKSIIELYSEATLNNDPRAYTRIEYPSDKAANDIMLPHIGFTMYKVRGGEPRPLDVGLRDAKIPSRALLDVVRDVVRKHQAEPPPPPPPPPAANPKSAWRPRIPFRGK